MKEMLENMSEKNIEMEMACDEEKKRKRAKGEGTLRFLREEKERR